MEGGEDVPEGLFSGVEDSGGAEGVLNDGEKGVVVELEENFFMRCYFSNQFPSSTTPPKLFLIPFRLSLTSSSVILV